MTLAIHFSPTVVANRGRRVACTVAVVASLSLWGSASADDAKPQAAPVTQPAAEADQTRPLPAEEIAPRFAELAHPDPAVREAARVTLMGLPRAQLPALEKLVRDSTPILPQQAAGLREIVTHIYLAGEKYPTSNPDGFLGVRPGEVGINVGGAGRPAVAVPPGDANPPLAGDAVIGVVVLERMAGFCGERMLQDGDVILGIVEKPQLQFVRSMEFSLAVRAMGAGHTIHFQLLRQGQVIRVPITLDPRPEDPEQFGAINPLAPLLDRRKALSDDYWERTFAPLLKEGVG